MMLDPQSEMLNMARMRHLRFIYTIQTSQGFKCRLSSDTKPERLMRTLNLTGLSGPERGRAARDGWAAVRCLSVPPAQTDRWSTAGPQHCTNEIREPRIRAHSEYAFMEISTFTRRSAFQLHHRSAKTVLQINVTPTHHPTIHCISSLHASNTVFRKIMQLWSNKPAVTP